MAKRVALAAAFGVGLAVLGYGAYALTTVIAGGKSRKKKQGKKGKKSPRKSRDAVMKIEAGVPRETLIKVLASINQSMARILPSVAQYEQQIRQQAPDASDDDIRQVVVQAYMDQLRKCETQVYQQFKVTEEQVKRAVDACKEDKDTAVTAHCNTMIKAYELVSQTKSPAKIPSHITKSKVLQVFREVMLSTANAIDGLVATLKATPGFEDFPKPKELCVKKFNGLLLRKAEEIALTITKSHDMTPQVSPTLYAIVHSFQPPSSKIVPLPCVPYETCLVAPMASSKVAASAPQCRR